jgi:hypothetical protein
MMPPLPFNARGVEPPPAPLAARARSAGQGAAMDVSRADESARAERPQSATERPTGCSRRCSAAKPTTASAGPRHVARTCEGTPLAVTPIRRLSSPPPTWLCTSLNHRCQGRLATDTHARRIASGRCSGATASSRAAVVASTTCLSVRSVPLASATSPLASFHRPPWRLRGGFDCYLLHVVRGCPRSFYSDPRFHICCSRIVSGASHRVLVVCMTWNRRYAFA